MARDFFSSPGLCDCLWPWRDRFHMSRRKHILGKAMLSCERAAGCFLRYEAAQLPLARAAELSWQPMCHAAVLKQCRPDEAWAKGCTSSMASQEQPPATGTCWSCLSLGTECESFTSRSAFHSQHMQSCQWFRLILPSLVGSSTKNRFFFSCRFHDFEGGYYTYPHSLHCHPAEKKNSPSHPK